MHFIALAAIDFAGDFIRTAFAEVFPTQHRAHIHRCARNPYDLLDSGFSGGYVYIYIRARITIQACDIDTAPWLHKRQLTRDRCTGATDLLATACFGSADRGRGT